MGRRRVDRFLGLCRINAGPSDTPNETKPTPGDSGAVSGTEGITPGAASASPAPPGTRQSRPRVIFGSGRGPHTSSPISAESVSGGNDTAVPVAKIVDDSKSAPHVSVPIEGPEGQRSSGDAPNAAESKPKKQSERALGPPSAHPAVVASASAKPTASRKAGALVPQGESTDINETGDGATLTVVAPLPSRRPRRRRPKSPRSS